MNAEQIARKLQGVRSELEDADATPAGAWQIGRILIAISMLTDVVEQLIADQLAAERRVDAIGRSIPAMRGDGDDE